MDSEKEEEHGEPKEESTFSLNILIRNKKNHLNLRSQLMPKD